MYKLCNCQSPKNSFKYHDTLHWEGHCMLCGHSILETVDLIKLNTELQATEKTIGTSGYFRTTELATMSFDTAMLNFRKNKSTSRKKSDVLKVKLPYDSFIDEIRNQCCFKHNSTPCCIFQRNSLKRS